MIVLVHAMTAAAAAPDCPFPSDHARSIPAKRDLPSAVTQFLGDMADKGEPFQAGDLIPMGRPPLARFMSAEGRGCDLVVEHEHGGRFYSKRTTRLRFNAGEWIVVSQ